MAATGRASVKRELAIALTAAWLASWAAEEHALQAAARDHMLSPVAVHERLIAMRAEQEQVRSLLS
jgi:hypothetical protein